MAGLLAWQPRALLEQGLDGERLLARVRELEGEPEGVERQPIEPSEAEVREVVASNLCRCTGYQGLVDAVLATARARLAAGPDGPGSPGSPGGDLG